MKTSHEWIQHFTVSAQQQRINWSLQPEISEKEVNTILHSLQAWQLGETSEGKQLLNAARLYAARIGDPAYVEAVTLFIKEEQKHGNNLGTYLDRIGKPRIKADWGDSLFRKIRHFNTSMEMWTLTVIIVESAAQLFYQSLKDATRCALLKQICTDILIDEAHHIVFQTERLAILFAGKSAFGKAVSHRLFELFFFGTALVVWMAHRKLFRAGGNTLDRFMDKMTFKYNRIMIRVLRFQNNTAQQYIPKPSYAS